MKRLTVLLMVVGLAVLMTASSVFAMTDSFRGQATAGLFGANDDDAADNIDDPVDVIRKFPKWVLLTRFSNLLNNAGSTSDKIFEYGGGDYDSTTPSRTFYGLMGSSEWFETNLGMPINFAVSYERTGEREALLDDSEIGSTVSTADGDGFGDATNGVEFADRRNYQNTAATETNFSVGYKVNDQLHAGLNWNFVSSKTTYVNDGERTDTVVATAAETTTTYENGLASDVLTLDRENTFKGNARYAVSDDVHVKGEVVLGLYQSQDNTPMDVFGAYNASVINTSGFDTDLPYSVEVEDAAGTVKKSLEVTSKGNGLIFGLKGKVYYFPLYKGQVNSELGYSYKGGPISFEETYTVDNGTAETEDKATLTGTSTTHNFTWDTRKYIEVDKLNVRLGLKYGYTSVTESGKLEIDFDNPAADDPSTDLVEKTATHKWSFPIGAEMALKENWTLRVGAAHSVSLATRTVNYEDDIGETNTTTQSDTRTTSYTYGVGYDWSENLKIDVNAFLMEPAQANGSTSRASILDLATYRNLAISAALIF